MKRRVLPLVAIGVIGLVMLLSAPPSSSQTDVHRTLDVLTSTPAHLVYVPLALGNWAPPPTTAPVPWTKKLHGYAAFTKIARLPLAYSRHLGDFNPLRALGSYSDS